EEAEEHEHHHEEGEVEYDEHVWLSLKSATTLVRAINDAMCQVDADNADTYKANATAYTEKLAALDAEYAACVKDAKYDTVLFGDRFPFRYLIDDYNLNYYAAFVGCSAETEASFETIAFLSEKVDELDLPAILVIETSDQKIAKTIQSNLTSAKADILVMDSIQSTKLGETSSYLDIMTQNLEVLKKALN
nr:metal ABC transporter substrate-binding protein [Lachnospiraceae bacterium]